MIDRENSKESAGTEAVRGIEELYRRQTRPPDFAAESDALVTLAARMAAEPEAALQQLVATIVDLSGAGSSAIVVLAETGEPVEIQLRAAAGAWADRMDDTPPVDAALCSLAVERDAAVLFRNPGEYAVTARRGPHIEEILLVPFRFAGQPVGAICAAAHSPEQKFDREDVRLLSRLAEIASASCGAQAAREAAGIAAEHGGNGANGSPEEDGPAHRTTEDKLVESEERYRALVEGMPQLVWRSESDGRWTWCSPQWEAATGLSRAQSLGQGWLRAVHPEDRRAALSGWRDATANGRIQSEIRIYSPDSGGYRWFRTRAAPARNASGRIVEWLGTSTDIDDLLRLQEQERRLLGELQHRVRNAISLIRSIVRRSSKTSESVEDYAMHLDGRINAFARVQAAVSRNPLQGLDLALLVSEELLAAVGRDSDRISADGPAVSLKPKAAELIGLALHELATNAMKFGALTAQNGRIDVTWRQEHSPQGPCLVLQWKESGAEGIPKSPEAHGFGSEVLIRALPYDLKADVEWFFEDGGVRCVIVVPSPSGIGFGPLSQE